MFKKLIASALHIEPKCGGAGAGDLCRTFCGDVAGRGIW